MFNQELDQIQKDLASFFEYARPDTEHNFALAKPYIQKWGTKFALMAGAYVVNQMQNFPMLLGGKRALDMAILSISVAHDLFMAYGDNAALILLAGIKSSSDEDVLAVDAYILAANNFADPRYCEDLREVLRRAVGTSCKILLSYTLFKCGDSREFLHFYNEGYLCPKSMAKGMIEMSRKDYPGKSRTEVENIVLEWHATGGSEHLLGVYGLFVMDNWTQGGFATDGYLSGLPWTRKTYPD